MRPNENERRVSSENAYLGEMPLATCHLQQRKTVKLDAFLYLKAFI